MLNKFIKLRFSRLQNVEKLKICTMPICLRVKSVLCVDYGCLLCSNGILGFVSRAFKLKCATAKIIMLLDFIYQNYCISLNGFLFTCRHVRRWCCANIRHVAAANLRNNTPGRKHGKVPAGIFLPNFA